MPVEFHATYEHGPLRLDVPLALPEHTRVAGVVNNIETPAASSAAKHELSPEEFERQLDELALDDVPPLPLDFSRADICLDHD